MYLSRITLQRNPSIKALNRLISPEDKELRMDANHRLLWTLFADHPDRRRDFLWREMRRGEFMVLSERKPEPCRLFSDFHPKPFNPSLNIGDQLYFSLRANATKRKSSKTEKPGERVDIVMDALKPLKNRAEKRMEIAQTEGENWLERQGKKHGFRIINCTVTDYSTYAIPLLDKKRMRKGQPQFGVIDVEGTIEVADLDLFHEVLNKGLGRAKAYGCGLMLIRRAK